MTTTCDEKLYSAKDNIDKSFNDLIIFLKPDTWGNSDYSDEYKIKVFDAIHKLLEIKQLLD